MPSNLPSSFASAAAGQNASRDSRGRGAVSGDWSRRDGRSANGTLTFRRSSTTPIGQSSQQPPENPMTAATSEHAPLQPPTEEIGPTRYTKDELLDMYSSRRAPDDPARLFISGWDPGHPNGNTRGWSKGSENHVPQEPGLCWDDNGDSVPLGLQELSADDKEAFSTDINSPLKHPTQNKESQSGSINGRKASLSQGTGNAYAVTSPSTAARPSTRRRETTDSNPFAVGSLASPTATNRFNRDDPSFWFPRKAGEAKDTEQEGSEQEQSSRDGPSKLPFGGLMRSHTSGGPSGGPSGSPIWPPSGQTSAGPGAFGSFTMGSTSAVGEKRVGSISGASRLAHLIPKDTSETASTKTGDGSNPLAQTSWRPRPRTDTDPFGDDGLSGSAVLGGAQDTDPQQGGRAGTLGTPVKSSTGDFGMAGLDLGGDDGEDPVSPSETNPYRSPPAERHDHAEADLGQGERSLGGGPMHEQPSGFSTLPRALGGAPFEGSDRSQTSSVGNKGYPLGGMAGWAASGGPSSGTPDRERANLGSAFGNSLFSPIAELQTPGLAGFNNVFGPPSAGLAPGGSIGRGSKLGSLFPPAMQAQMQSHDPENSLADSVPDFRQTNPLGAIGRSNFPAPSRDTESPMRANRGVFEELFPSSDPSRPHGMFGAIEPVQTPGAAAGPQSFTPVSGGLPFGAGQAGAEPQSAQARQMVMPDRMRWVYLDPQGQVQGPFTGLEMNDWYKAHFFTPDLRVKKLEDPEFEPLGQLIRRIGNSREPFLVPQIGIPHGPPTQSSTFPGSSNAGVVPPLSGVFPSFGRTLTAEEQNNLERRKQEEQFMMAQQREFLMRQQAMSKLQMPGQGLQHHPSAHSLQSQPSFGSMTSPALAPPPGQQQQPSTGGVPAAPGYFGGAAPGGQSGSQGGSGSREFFRDDDVAQLSSQERQMLATMPSGPAEAVAVPSDAEGGLRAGLPTTDQLGEDPEGFRGRLREFEGLRAQHEAEQAIAHETQRDYGNKEMTEAGSQDPALGKPGKGSKKFVTDEALLSLTQQVQQAQAQAAATLQPVEPGMPMPFPPPSSNTPLPAPTAQRVRSNLPEQYSRDQTDSPDTNASVTVQAPSLAPWAKEPGIESQRGPSLKEIQEAEARKAAKVGEAAAAARKAAMEQEAAIMREKETAAAAVAAAGLPASSTWGHGSPVPATIPWTKPTPAKAPAPGLPSTTASGSKKTLAEIQREEELRKQKAREVGVQIGAPPPGVSKSYANLAGKPGHPAIPSPQSATPIATPTGGWATVGAGGRVKIPTGPAAQMRSASSSNVTKPVAMPVKPVSKPAVSNGKSEGNTAMDEFNKWVGRELSRGITGVNDIASFQAGLDALPLDTGIIADAVYANSTTMDGRHFAEEFIRRKRLAEKGVVEKQPMLSETKSAGTSSGWSEVAKKGGVGQIKEDATVPAAGFKVVPSRKKGKK